MSGTNTAHKPKTCFGTTGIHRVVADAHALSRISLPDPTSALQYPLAAADALARRTTIETLESTFRGLPLSTFTQTTDAASLAIGEASEKLLASLASEDFLERIFQQFAFSGGMNLKLVREQEHRSLDDVIVTDPSAHLNGLGRVRPAAVAAALADGFTVVLDGIDLRDPTSVMLAGLFERSFGCTVNINGYLSARHQTSFSTHWDDQEVVILQLVGRKDWIIEEPAALSMNKESHGDKVSGRTVWQGRLNVGDALYVPHGWGHIVNGINELTYHHTITIPRINGLHALEGILTDPATRKDNVRYGSLPMVPGRSGIDPLPLDPANTDQAVRRALARARFNISRRSITSLRATVKALTSRSLNGVFVRCPAPGGWTVATSNDSLEPAAAPPPDSLVVGQAGQFLAVPHHLIAAVGALTDGRTHDAGAADPEVVRALIRLSVLEVVADPDAWGITLA